MFPSNFMVQTLFTAILRPDKHAELLKFYFKPLIETVKFLILDTRSDLKFKIH